MGDGATVVACVGVRWRTDCACHAVQSHTHALHDADNQRKNMMIYSPMSRWLVPAGLCLTLIVVSTQAMARDAASSERARRYQEDRKACLSGDTNQMQSACLKEAKARFAEKPGETPRVGAEQLRQNASVRCDALNGTDRDDCLARMRGEGTTQGNAQSGGIYRELVTPAPVPPSK